MAADAQTLDRIQKLLRLAQDNPNEHEASAAALKAAKMLKEAGVTVGRALDADFDAAIADIFKQPIINPRQTAARRTHAPSQAQANFDASKRREGNFTAGVLNEQVIRDEVRRRVAIERKRFDVSMAHAVTLAKKLEGDYQKAREDAQDQRAANMKMAQGLVQLQLECDILKREAARKPSLREWLTGWVS